MRRLKLEELFVGAYVYTYPSEVGVVPMMVKGIYPDSSVLLDDGVKYTLDVIAGVRICGNVLRHMGFVKARGEDVFLMMARDVRLTVSLRQRHGDVCCRRVAVTGRVTCWNEEIRYVHELQRWWIDRVLLSIGIPLPLVYSTDVEPEKEYL